MQTPQSEKQANLRQPTPLNSPFTCDLPDLSPDNLQDKNHFFDHSKNEYEEIKQRVSAIETRLSQEFNRIEASLADNSLDYSDACDSKTFNGLERVLNRYEQTLEETDFMKASPSTELAEELGRGLNIRRKPEQKIFRSPSARKISKVRRSLEGAPVTRNKSWHFSSKSPVPIVKKRTLQELDPLLTPVRSKGNSPHGNVTVTSTFKKPIHKSTEFLVSPQTSITANKTVSMQEPHMRNEEWICADTYFNSNFNSHAKENSKMVTTPKKVTPKKEDSKMKVSNETKIFETPRSVPLTFKTPIEQKTTPKKVNVNNLSSGKNIKTPMLPPRVPVARKTPGTCSSTSKVSHASLSAYKSKSYLTPLWNQEQEQMAGRASIARLRRQNAGMVMAKARLFNELVMEKEAPSKVEPAVLKRDHNRVLSKYQIKSPSTMNRGLKNSNDSVLMKRHEMRTSGVFQQQDDNAQMSIHHRRHSRSGRTPEQRLLRTGRTPEQLRKTPNETTPQARRNLMNKQPRRIVRVQNR